MNIITIICFILIFLLIINNFIIYKIAYRRGYIAGMISMKQTDDYTQKCINDYMEVYYRDGTVEKYSYDEDECGTIDRV